MRINLTECDACGRRDDEYKFSRVQKQVGTFVDYDLCKDCINKALSAVGLPKEEEP